MRRANRIAETRIISDGVKVTGSAGFPVSDDARSAVLDWEAMVTGLQEHGQAEAWLEWRGPRP